MAGPTEPMNVLEEVRNLMADKANDYQNPSSTVKQAMHYRRGIDTLHDMLHQKMLRAQSLIEAAADGSKPRNEPLEDTYKDIIAYAAFAVTYLRGKMDGQCAHRGMFNRAPPVKAATRSKDVDVITGVGSPTDELIEAHYHATRHAKARGLPPELAKTPFPPAGDPAYSPRVPRTTDWPVDPYDAREVE